MPVRHGTATDDDLRAAEIAIVRAFDRNRRAYLVGDDNDRDALESFLVAARNILERHLVELTNGPDGGEATKEYVWIEYRGARYGGVVVDRDEEAGTVGVHVTLTIPIDEVIPAPDLAARPVGWRPGDNWRDR